MELDRAMEGVYRALSHRLRRAILRQLLFVGEASFTELMAAVGAKHRASIAYHIRDLLASGLVECTRKHVDRRGVEALYFSYYRLTDLGRYLVGEVEPRIADHLVSDSRATRASASASSRPTAAAAAANG